MSTASNRSHRARSSRPEYLTMLVSLVAVLALGGVCGYALAQWYGSETETGQISGTPTETPSATSPPTTAAPTPTPTTQPDDVARNTKPLQSLERGDRVLYDANPSRPVCTWLLWVGSIATSTIRCGAETFEVETGFLTPVERLP